MQTKKTTLDNLLMNYSATTKKKRKKQQMLMILTIWNIIKITSLWWIKSGSKRREKCYVSL